MKTGRILMGLLTLPVMLSGCYTNTAAGAQTGAAWGTTLGSAIGSITGNSAWGTVIGMAGGAMAGAAVGAAMDRQQQTAAQGGQQLAAGSGSGTAVLTASAATPQSTVAIADVRWEDDGDGSLSAGEVARLSFNVINTSEQPLTGLVPVVVESTKARKVSVSPSVTVGSLDGKAGVRYTAAVAAQKGIKAGELRFRAYVTQDGSIVSNVEEVTVPVAK